MAQKGIVIQITADSDTAAAQLKSFFDAVSSGMSRMRGGVGQALDAFRAMPPAIAGIALAATVATAAVGFLSRELIQGTQAAINYADGLGKAAQRMGITVEKLSGLSVAAKLADVSTEELGRSLAFLGKRVSEAEAGNEDAKQLFRDLEISTRDASGQLKTADAILSEVADRFAAMPDGITKTRLAMELFERNGQNLIPLLNGGSENIEKLRIEAEKLGLTISKDFSQNAEHFNDNISRLKLAAQGLFLHIAERLLPYLVKFSDWLVDTVEAITSHVNVIDILVEAYKVFAEAAAKALFVLDAFYSTLDSFATTLSETGNPFLAWADAADTLNGKIDGLKKRLAEIAEIGKPAGKVLGPPPPDSVEARRLARAKFEADRKELDLQIAEQDVVAANINNQHYAPAKRQAELNAVLEKQIDLLNEKWKLTQQAKDAGIITAREQREFDVKDFSAVVQKQGAVEPVGIGANMRHVLRDLAEVAGTVAHQIAETFKEVIGAAISSVSRGITGLIEGTTTWGQALRQIGSSILNVVIEAVVNMFAKWVIGQNTATAATLAGQTATMSGELSKQAAVTPGKLVEALATAIAEGGWGAVAIIAAAVAALGVGVAAAAGAFAEGGRPPVGRTVLVGEEGPELFVADRPGSVVPANVTSEYLNSMHSPTGSHSREARRKGRGREETRIHIYMLENRSIPSSLRTPEADEWFLDMAARNLHRIT